jgi:hypothetical protein
MPPMLPVRASTAVPDLTPAPCIVPHQDSTLVPIPFSIRQDQIKNETYPQEQQESAKISKSRIKSGFYLNSSRFSVRGRSPAPLQSLKPTKDLPDALADTFPHRRL